MTAAEKERLHPLFEWSAAYPLEKFCDSLTLVLLRREIMAFENSAGEILLFTLDRPIPFLKKVASPHLTVNPMRSLTRRANTFNFVWRAYDSKRGGRAEGLCGLIATSRTFTDSSLTGWYSLFEYCGLSGGSAVRCRC